MLHLDIMASQDLFTVFNVQTAVYYSNPLVCEFIDDPMDIDTTPTIYLPTTSSILKKRGQNKKVSWEASVVDNEYKATARKQQRQEEYSRQFIELQAAIVDQEALIKRQGAEILRLKGLWARVQIGKIDEGLEHYAPIGADQEVLTAIQAKLWELLLELKPKREKSDKILASYQQLLKKFDRKLKLTRRNVTSLSATPVSNTNHIINVIDDEDCDLDGIS